MKRFLVGILILLVVVLVALPLGLFLLVRTETGSRWLLAELRQRAPVQVLYSEMQGNLLQGMHFADFGIEGEGFSLRAAQLDVAWQPQMLWFGTLKLDHLRLIALDIETDAAADGDPAESQWPRLQLPLRLVLADLSISAVRLQQRALVDQIEAGLEVVGNRLLLESLDIQRPDDSLHLAGEIVLAAPYPLSLDVEWQYDAAAWRGRASLLGSLADVQIQHQLTAPYAVDSGMRLTWFLPERPTDLDIEDLVVEGVHRAAQLDLRQQLGDAGLLEDVELATRGGLAVLDIEGRFQTNLPWLGNARVSASGRFEQPQLVLDQLSVESARGELSATTVRLDAESRRIDVEQLQVADLALPAPLAPLQVDLSGLELQFAEGLQLTVQIRQAETLLGSETIVASGPVRFENGQFSSTGVELRSTANSLQLNGRLYPDLALSWQLQGPELAALASAYVPGGLDQLSLSATGSLEGSYAAPRLSLRLEGSSLTAPEVRLESWQAEIRPTAEGHALNLQTPQIVVRGRQLSGLNLEASLADGNVRFDASLALGELAFELAGRANRDPLWQLQLDQLDLLSPEPLGNWRLEQGLQLDQLDNGWSLRSGCWLSTQASLCGEADIRPGSRILAELHLDNLPLNFLEYLSPLPLRLEGQLNGNLSLDTGSGYPDLRADLYSEVGSLVVLGQDQIPDPVVYRALSLQAQVTYQRLEGSALVELGETGRAQWQGQIDFAETTPELVSRALFDFSSIQWLEAVFPQLDGIGGGLNLELQTSGPWQNPAFRLAGALENGRFILPQAGIELDAINLRVSTDDQNRIALLASVTSGGGELRMSGTLTAASLQSLEVAVQVEGSNFLALDRSDLRLRVDPQLELLLNSTQLQVAGRLGVPEALARVRVLPAGGVRVSEDEIIVGDSAGPKERRLQRQIDVQIEPGSRVRFEGFGLSTRVAGTMELSQQSGDPLRTFGAIELLEGEYQAYSRTLEMRRGRMVFQGELDNPALDIDAEQSYPDYLVGIHLGGTAQEPTPTLYSTPVMAQSDILAVLLTGQKLETMAASEAPTLLDAVTQLGIVGGASIADRLEKNFGLSEFGVRNDAENGQSIVAGTYLLPRLYVEWAQGLFESSSSVQLEYRISNQLRLKARSGNSQSMDLIYEIERD